MGADAKSAARAMTPSEPADAELLDAIARGDREAYAAIYRRYASILLGLLIRIFRDRSEAEDVLQEAFVQIWKRAGDFDERRGQALHWLATVARNRALDRLSTLRSRERIAARQPLEPSPEESADPAEEASLAEDAREVRRALGEIPESQRRVLLLAYFEGLSQSEIAARLDAPLGTVKSHARLGLMKLREVLGK
jgi:RNA polymerase sigma-70 factor, ECF subfamily